MKMKCVWSTKWMKLLSRDTISKLVSVFLGFLHKFRQGFLDEGRPRIMINFVFNKIATFINENVFLMNFDEDHKNWIFFNWKNIKIFIHLNWKLILHQKKIFIHISIKILSTKMEFIWNGESTIKKNEFHAVKKRELSWRFEEEFLFFFHLILIGSFLCVSAGNLCACDISPLITQWIRMPQTHLDFKVMWEWCKRLF